jgi:hypothetical protein
MLAGFLHQLDEADLGFSRGDLPVTVGNSRLPGSGSCISDNRNRKGLKARRLLS